MPQDQKFSVIEAAEIHNQGQNGMRTDWKAIVIAALVTFIAAVENTVLGMSEWAYMNEIDKEANAQFFGNATALSKIFHAIAALFFAFWCFHSQSFRIPLICGRLLAFFACLLYLCVEMSENGRRYIMSICYVLFGIASSSSSILRAYVAAISLENDRPQAYSAITAAIMLSIIIGPLIQACFTGIVYPGIEILPNVRFHIYSAPVWVAASTNFISIAIIFFCLKELPKKAKSNMAREKSLLTLTGIKNRIETISHLQLDWPTVILCWLMKIISNLNVTTLTTLTSLFYINNYGWSRPTTVLSISLLMGAVGILSVTISILYFFCNLGKIISQRFAFLIGMCIFATMYILAYPWTPISQHVAPYQAADDLGCKTTEFSWCSYALAPSPWVLLVVIAMVMGIGIPLALVALDAIYSKCLGNINQSVMQGAMIVAEDVVNIIGPIYTSAIFTSFGFGTLWAFNGVLVTLGTLLWILNIRKLKIYS